MYYCPLLANIYSQKNPRLATYCCYHPISLPPSYAPPPTLQSTSSTTTIPAAATTTAAEAVTHHLRPHDTLLSLSFAYNIPLDVLRQHNRVFADSVLPGRRTVEIPAGYAAAVGGSLSGEEEEGVRRKREVKRFMLRTKCTDQLVAGAYLDLGGSVERAVERWLGDGEWVKREGKKRGAR